MFFHCPWPAWWCHPKLPNYACATRSSLPADQFHTETSGRFALTWYCCKILYLSEILSMVLHPRWSHAVVTWHFVVISCKQIQSHEREPEWTQPGAKVAHALLTGSFSDFVDIFFETIKFSSKWVRNMIQHIHCYTNNGKISFKLRGTLESK